MGKKAIEDELQNIADVPGLREFVQSGCRIELRQCEEEINRPRGNIEGSWRGLVPGSNTYDSFLLTEMLLVFPQVAQRFALQTKVVIRGLVKSPELNGRKGT